MTGARPDTWMPVYIGDYLADTMHLSYPEHGAYLLLIFAYWRSGKPLADDDQELSSICRASLKEWKKMRPRISRFFHVEDGTWRHKRIEQELARSQEISNERSKAGAIGAAKRWQTDSKRMATAVANEEQNDANHSHSHNTSSLRSEISDGKSKRGTRLSADWQPGEQDREFAGTLGLDIESTAASFRDYWLAKPSNATKLDWPATWRIWCRRAAERAPSGTGSGGSMANRPGPPSLVAAARRAAARFES